MLPETASTGFTPGCSKEELWDLVTELPGRDDRADPGRRPRAGRARLLRHLRARPGARRRLQLVGAHRPVGRRCSASTARRTRSAPSIVSGGGWVTPGDTVTVCDTELGRIGMIICFDGDYPELSRIQAVQGAEVICRPSALLRSADIWDLTSRARAYDNHVYVIGANAVGADPAGVLYFGNSHIVTPIGHIVAKAATHEGWVSARLDPADGALVADARVQRRPGLRPPARPQPRPHPQPPRRARGRRRDVLPARPDPPGRRRLTRTAADRRPLVDVARRSRRVGRRVAPDAHQRSSDGWRCARSGVLSPPGGRLRPSGAPSPRRRRAAGPRRSR